MQLLGMVLREMLAHAPPAPLHPQQVIPSALSNNLGD